MLADGHLALLHGFEQCTLHLGWSAVDFVGQHEVGKHWALLHLKLFFLHAIHHGAHHVGWQKVGGELNAAIFCVDNRCKGLDGKRFCQARHTLEQDVAIGQKGDEQRIHQVLLAHDSLVHTLHNGIHKIAFACNQII